MAKQMPSRSEPEDLITSSPEEKIGESKGAAQGSSYYYHSRFRDP